jgi:holo-[acyl-carrier protein] synthase
MIPAGHEARIELSMTDEGPLAQAMVIIHAVPVANPADSR